MTITTAGFTGTRTRPTSAQCTWVDRQLRQADLTSVRHGVCVGSDAVFHRLSVMWGKFLYLHPPINQKYLDQEALALSRASEKCHVLAPKGYHARNRDIVDGSDILLATPRMVEIEDNPTSGTWMTINYARSLGRPRLICLPDGQVLDS